MYFPSLNLLHDYEFDAMVINKFDSWLGTLRGSKRTHIRPARFAVDMGVDFNISNELFSVSTIELKLFSINYEIYCPHCPQEMVGFVHNINDIPEKAKCRDCQTTFFPYEHEEYIQLTFNLTQTPDPNSPKNLKERKRPKTFSQLKPNQQQPRQKAKALYLSTFLQTPISRPEIDKAIFQPDWEQFDKAYDRFIKSLQIKEDTQEKGDALEELSRILLSFITIFQVDITKKTLTNQLDVTVYVKPYLKTIEIPILKVLDRRLICECKNEDKNVPSIWVDKLFGVINKTDNTKAGIIFSYHKFSGDEMKHAFASQIEYARLGKYIININKDDLDKIKEERPNIFYLLDSKFHALEMRESLSSQRNN